MRFFFHITDRYGVSPDGIGFEFGEEDAAVLHARCLAAELAKSGELFRGSVVLVARETEPASCHASEDDTAAYRRET
ncbi:hypothetical protein [Bradyrhizobium sp. RP6]|uniref:DUF6894 family protein n=1 Tax=Bradyrhizobium sp. RP6 TaxID=2489596 RepID=UPI000F532B10|nr:hypothetical protein [Bradyrhizobium sp. RP6]RQH15744.1 hypothetical protein EHH60_00660 [Bradyrhizobium sp. RP6]